VHGLPLIGQRAFNFITNLVTEHGLHLATTSATRAQRQPMKTAGLHRSCRSFRWPYGAFMLIEQSKPLLISRYTEFGPDPLNDIKES